MCQSPIEATNFMVQWLGAVTCPSLTAHPEVLLLAFPMTQILFGTVVPFSLCMYHVCVIQAH